MTNSVRNFSAPSESTLSRNTLISPSAFRHTSIAYEDQLPSHAAGKGNNMTAQIEVDAERLKLLVAYCREHLGEPIDWKAMAGYPSSLALCVIDAIQSTGPHYASVMNVVSRYRGYRLGQGGNADTDGAQALLTTFDELNGPEMATDGWADTIGNQNRTYQRKQAPLKSVAIRQAAQRLAEAGVDSTD
jgi:hypothetical protein